MQPRRDYLLVRGLRKYCLSNVARNKCFHTICVHNINWQNMHTSKDEKHLTRHWREITLTSALLWQSIEFITSYNLEYCWPGLCSLIQRSALLISLSPAKPFTTPHIVIHHCLFI